jgi:hypothetical protein
MGEFLEGWALEMKPDEVSFGDCNRSADYPDTAVLPDPAPVIDASTIQPPHFLNLT